MPFATPPTNLAATFGRLVDEALRARPTPDASHALMSGVDVYGLCRYAAVACSKQERGAMQRQLLDHPWAHSRVVALVKGARDPGSVAAAVISAARRGAWTGLAGSVSADPEADLAKLLDSIG